jgi:hypothetical protein
MFLRNVGCFPSVHCFIFQKTEFFIIEVGVEDTLLLTVGRSVGQSVSISWYRAPLWDFRPDITSCRNVAVRNLRSCVCGVPSLTGGRVCNLQCNHWMVWVAQNPLPYFTVSSETPKTWRARMPYLDPPGTGWPSYAPGRWVPFRSSFTTRLWRVATAAKTSISFLSYEADHVENSEGCFLGSSAGSHIHKTTFGTSHAGLGTKND